MNQKLKLGAAALGGIVATLAAGGIAFASMGHGLGPIGNADLDDNGEVTRTEWVQKAGEAFDRLDANKDGKLVVGEIPPPPHHGHGRPHPGPDFHDDDDWGPDAGPVTAPPPAADNSTEPAPAPQPAK
ncbi:MAG: hypothetical protein V4574_15895 [Pseudomonadota bacterium]